MMLSKRRVDKGPVCAYFDAHENAFKPALEEIVGPFIITFQMINNNLQPYLLHKCFQTELSSLLFEEVFNSLLPSFSEVVPLIQFLYGQISLNDIVIFNLFVYFIIIQL